MTSDHLYQQIVTGAESVAYLNLRILLALVQLLGSLGHAWQSNRDGACKKNWRFSSLFALRKCCVSSWDLVNDDVMRLGFSREEGLVEARPTKRVILTAWFECTALSSTGLPVCPPPPFPYFFMFPTCMARLDLLRVMEQIQTLSSMWIRILLFFFIEPVSPGHQRATFLVTWPASWLPGNIFRNSGR